MTDNDLPLLSNINDMRARHYLINLSPSFHDKVFQGKVTIFFEVTTACEKRGKCCTHTCFCCSADKVSDKNPAKVLPLSQIPIPSEVQERNDRTTENLGKDFELTLDCCDIKVKKVSEVLSDQYEISEYLDPKSTSLRMCHTRTWADKKKLPLEFSVNQWCIKIVKTGVKNAHDFPQVLCIEYETLPQGKSVLWRNDQDGNLCVFTPAAAINNRSLLPCQDPPSAMATWQAWVTVPDGYYVSMTGDGPSENWRVPYDEKEEMINSSFIFNKGAEVRPEENFLQHCEFKSKLITCFYCYTSMILPIATIAIAIGKWQTKKLGMLDLHFKNEETNELHNTTRSVCKHYEYPCHLDTKAWSKDTKMMMVYPSSFSEQIKPLGDFLPFAVKAAVELLGTYPCKRIEVVVLPHCFGSLGLASPNLIMLSPSLVLNDHAAFIRIAHEVSHAWFGINIGAQDWTEEWISEGFATYMEDLIFAEAIMAYQEEHSEAISWVTNVHPFCEAERADKMVTKQQLEDLADLRAHLRYRTLNNEIENSNEDLQMLRPMQGESYTADGIHFVKDGLNPEKTFLQVHYLKGYFLLKYLHKLVGNKKFSLALKVYVAQFHGQLVSSKDILMFLMDKCPEISDMGVTLDYLFNNWLHQPGLNIEMKESYATISNSLMECVKMHYNFWYSFNKRLCKGLNKRFIPHLEHFLFPDQLVLLFEMFLEIPNIQSRILSTIYMHYAVTQQNADIRHRWCELVIKYNFHDLTEVERFLTMDQSMGVYLYGELMISEKSKHRSLAKKIFKRNENEMDENARSTVKAMLFG